MPMIQGVSQKKDNKWTSSQDPNMLNNVINMATEHGSQAQVYDSEKQVVRNLSFKQKAVLLLNQMELYLGQKMMFCQRWNT